MGSVCTIVLNWNGWKDTLKCLSSLKASDYPSNTVIVVDNGSTDESVERIQTAKDEQLVLLQNPTNDGFAGGNNVGIQYALESGAEFVWLLNNDTVVHPLALSAMVETARSDERIGAVGSVLYEMSSPDIVQAWGGGRVNSLLGTSRHHKVNVPEAEIDFLTAASLLIRSAALKDVGLLDDGFFMYWEDADFCYRLKKSGWRLSVSADSRVLHRESASVGRGSATMDVYFNESAVRFFRKHSAFPLLPIGVGAGGRLIKRLWRLDFGRVAAVWSGLRA